MSNSNPATTSEDHAEDYVRIFDTTLRDGEQAPGCTMNVEEKIAIARQLERLNVDVIEAGFAASSPGDFESVNRIAQTLTGPRVLSLSRTRIEDVDAALSAVDKAKTPGIHIFIATSEIHMRHKLNMTCSEFGTCSRIYLNSCSYSSGIACPVVSGRLMMPAPARTTSVTTLTMKSQSLRDASSHENSM